MKLLLVIVPALLLICLAPLSAEAKTFDNDKYKFEYPNGCKLEKKENRFTSIDASMDCKGDASFQFETTDTLSDVLIEDTDDGMLDTLLTALESQWSGVYEIERGTDKYIINNQTAPYIITSYDQEFSNAFGLTKTENWGLMAIVMKIGNDIVIGQYQNNEDSFDKQLPMAEKIFQSVKGFGNETKGETETDNSFINRGEDFAKTRELCDTVTTQSGKELCETLLN
jgi:hypothetical protein